MSSLYSNLEVGVDMKNVSNIMTHRAMRNIASYRQKAGRAGREKIPSQTP